MKNQKEFEEAMKKELSASIAEVKHLESYIKLKTESLILFPFSNVITEDLLKLMNDLSAAKREQHMVEKIIEAYEKNK